MDRPSNRQSTRARTVGGEGCERKEIPMRYQRTEGQSRRGFLRELTLVGMSALLGVKRGLVAAEPPPETTRLGLPKTPGICIAPQVVAEELLHAEGFTDGQYVAVDPARMVRDIYQQLVSGAADITVAF